MTFLPVAGEAVKKMPLVPILPLAVTTLIMENLYLVQDRIKLNRYQKRSTYHEFLLRLNDPLQPTTRLLASLQAHQLKYLVYPF